MQLNERDSSDEGSGGEHDMDSDSGDYAPTAPTPDPDPTPAKVNIIGIDWTNIFNAAGFVSQSSLTCSLNLTKCNCCVFGNFPNSTAHEAMFC